MEVMAVSDRIERRVTLPATAEEAWRALTRDLSLWFGARASFDRIAPGAHIEFAFDDGSTRAAVIEEAEPGVRLSFRWLPFARADDGTPQARDVSRVEMTLEPDGDECVLTVLEVGSRSGAPSGPMWAKAGAMWALAGARR